MKLLDVVAQIQTVLPKYTSYFSDDVSVSSISVTGDTATIVTLSAHGLTTGQGVTIHDVGVRTPISSVSKDGLVYTFTTSSDHDLTYGWPEHDTVKFDGFTDPSWNDSFKLLAVQNRRTLDVQSTLSSPVLNGNEVLLESRVDGINGRHSVTVVDSTTFTITGDFLDGDYSGGNVKKAVRIAGSVTAERALEQYTEQGLDSLWLVVVPRDNVETSKDRKTNTDAQLTATAGDTIRMRMLDGFTVLLIKNVTQDITANDAIDIARHELLRPILKTVLGTRFDTGLSGDGDFKTVLLGHNFVEYNKAIFVYAYSFETPMDITDDDAVDQNDTRAFRDVNYVHDFGTDVTDLSVTEIDLDEEPL